MVRPEIGEIDQARLDSGGVLVVGLAQLLQKLVGTLVVGQNIVLCYLDRIYLLGDVSVKYLKGLFSSIIYFIADSVF